MPRFGLALLCLVATAPLVLAQSIQGPISYRPPASGSGHGVVVHRSAIALERNTMEYASSAIAIARFLIPLPRQATVQPPKPPPAANQMGNLSGQ